MSTLRAGIDYSMSCPALSMFSKGKEEFSFESCTLGYLSEKNVKTGLPNIIGAKLTEYTTTEERFDLISDWAMSAIDAEVARTGATAVEIFIEDYSYGSTGRVFGIAENAGLVKHKCYKRGWPISPIPPTVIKKFASGKGNARKEGMFAAFLQDTGVDLMKIYSPKAQNVGSPVGDLVDAFYICKYGVMGLNK